MTDPCPPAPSRIRRLATLAAAGPRALARVWRRRWARRLVAAALLVALVLGAGWTVRNGWAIYRLNRGVGGTVFHDAAGRPWFPLDEARRDVPLNQIATFAKDAVIAVEDHRYYLHPGVDPLALGRAAFYNVGPATAARAAAPSPSSWPARSTCRTRAPTRESSRKPRSP